MTKFRGLLTWKSIKWRAYMHTVTLPFFSNPNLSIVSTLGTFHVRITIYIRGKEEGRAERSRQDRGIQPTFISGFKGRGEEDVLLCAEGKVGGQFIDRECTGGKIEDNRLHTPVNSWPAQRWNKYCSAMRKKKSGIKSGSSRSGFARFIGPINSR